MTIKVFQELIELIEMTEQLAKDTNFATVTDIKLDETIFDKLEDLKSTFQGEIRVREQKILQSR